MVCWQYTTLTYFNGWPYHHWWFLDPATTTTDVLCWGGGRKKQNDLLGRHMELSGGCTLRFVATWDGFFSRYIFSAGKPSMSNWHNYCKEECSVAVLTPFLRLPNLRLQIGLLQRLDPRDLFSCFLAIAASFVAALTYQKDWEHGTTVTTHRSSKYY